MGLKCRVCASGSAVRNFLTALVRSHNPVIPEARYYLGLPVGGLDGAGVRAGAGVFVGAGVRAGGLPGGLPGAGGRP